jgi:hypothetical protein
MNSREEWLAALERVRESIKDMTGVIFTPEEFDSVIEAAMGHPLPPRPTPETVLTVATTEGRDISVTIGCGTPPFAHHEHVQIAEAGVEIMFLSPEVAEEYAAALHRAAAWVRET